MELLARNRFSSVRSPASLTLCSGLLAGLVFGILQSPSLTTARAQSPSAGATTETPPAEGFVVHEWGTFTSMQGSDGMVLEGLHHEEEALPGFVHDLGSLLELGSTPGLKFPASSVVQKMETPVLYFHTPEALRATVDVYYLHGLLTQYYPAPEIVGPGSEFLRRHTHDGVLDFRQIDAGVLRWTVDVIPRSEGKPAGIPEVATDDPWDFARRVDAAFVRTVEDHETGRIAEAEHFLFYRGLSNQKLPIAVQAKRGGRARVQSNFAEAVPFALALEVTPDGGRFRVLGMIDPDSEIDFDLSGRPIRSDLDEVVADLSTTIHEALVEEGLFADEARAMVDTWSRQWFRSQGHRVIYLMPKESLEKSLRLDIRPRPDHLVRVLVGRLEYLTPEREDAVDRALRDLDHEDPLVSAGAHEHLQGLGRFLEPHLRRVLGTEDDDSVLRAAEELLADIDR